VRDIFLGWPLSVSLPSDYRVQCGGVAFTGRAELAPSTLAGGLFIVAKDKDKDKEKRDKENELQVRQVIAKFKPALIKLDASNAWRLKKLSGLILMSRLLDNDKAEAALKKARGAARDYARVIDEQSNLLEVFVKEYIKAKKVGDILKLEGDLKGLNDQATAHYGHYRAYKVQFRAAISKQFEKYSGVVKKVIDEIVKEKEAFDQWRRDFAVTREAIRLYAVALTSSNKSVAA